MLHQLASSMVRCSLLAIQSCTLQGPVRALCDDCTANCDQMLALCLKVAC